MWLGNTCNEKFGMHAWFLASVMALSLVLACVAPAQARPARQSAPAASKVVAKTSAKPSGKTSTKASTKRARVASSKSVAKTSAKYATAKRSNGKLRSPAVVVARKEPQMASAQLPLMPIAVNAPAGVSSRLTASTPVSGASGASYGQIYGLHHTPDPLELKSSVALVMDQDTNEIVLSKNSEAVLPIASLTKLMTATIIVEAHLPMDEPVTISNEDVDTEKNSSSRLSVGTTLTRGELLHLALMSSENRAAHALGRTYPAGLSAFVAAMNAKAMALGMHDTRYVDPTGLNSGNQSSARDLAVLVKSAYKQPLIRELSTSPEYAVRLGSRQTLFRNTNSLVRNPSWDIGLQKTGYIVEAGRCLVMQASMVGRKYIMIFLDSAGKYSRQGDAERVRHWLEQVSRKGAMTTTVVPSASKVTS